MNFESWFEIATKNIAKAECSRIRNELEAHVIDAIHFHQQTGISTLEAEQKAVLELGDPKVAARGFEREYLTRDQARRFMPESKSSIWFKILGVSGLSAIYLLLLRDVFVRYPTLFPAFSAFFVGNNLVAALLLFLDSLARYVLVRQPRIQIAASVMVIEYLTMTTACVVWFLFAPAPFQLPLWTCLGMLTCLLGGLIFVELPLLRKLRA